jgi:hypothetical protein
MGCKPVIPVRTNRKSVFASPQKGRSERPSTGQLLAAVLTQGTLGVLCHVEFR